MTAKAHHLLSVVVPVYNEAAHLAAFHHSLIAVLKDLDLNYEAIYCNDGSQDQTAQVVQEFADDHVKLISLSRNFGKEMALTAGITQATGDAVLMLDGDGQHPVEQIPQFVAAWRNGAQVVVGIRTNTGSRDRSTGAGSRLFYQIFNRLSSQKLVPGSTDFRLIDKAVQTAFLELPETDRLTRGLIDWLGFKRTEIAFTAKARPDGQPGYSRGKLMELAVNSLVSLSPKPLYLFGLLGVLLTGAALVLGGVVFIEQILLGDPFGWNFTGTAALSILVLFFVGTILMSQGLMSLYVSHIHDQSKQRPLYVIDYSASVGIKRK